MSRRKKRRSLPYDDVELNIMPFIDIFSMLNTFLLFSAVFLSVGILEVQIPFLSNATPEKKEDTRIYVVNVSAEKDKIQVDGRFSAPPENLNRKEFPNTPDGRKQMHQHLVDLRKANPDTDKATIFAEDDVLWDSLSQIVDAVMLRASNDPVFPLPKDAKNIERAQADAKTFVYPKVVMGSVMLR